MLHHFGACFNDFSRALLLFGRCQGRHLIVLACGLISAQRRVASKNLSQRLQVAHMLTSLEKPRLFLYQESPNLSRVFPHLERTFNITSFKAE